VFEIGRKKIAKNNMFANLVQTKFQNKLDEIDLKKEKKDFDDSLTDSYAL
jgi:hypothetical protein